MTFEELITSDFFHLPIVYSARNFQETIFSVLDDFLDRVNQLIDGSLEITQLSISSEFVKRSQKQLIQGLKSTIRFYYDGRPAESYKKLHKTLVGNMKDFNEVFKVNNYEVGENFYRLRIAKENYPLQPLDMFHIPFEMRGKVKTQRYSIPGFPSLYLGRTLYGAWEEMRRPSIAEFQAVRLESTKGIRYLDLTKPSFLENVNTREIYRYFMTWPLIACCSVKVKDSDDFFKPEYIIPQLLLQWVRNAGPIDGIRYNSTHINFHTSKSEGDFSNLVLPVKETMHSGHCRELKSMFKITEPISWQLKEFSLGGQLFMYSSRDFEKINSRIPKLELIKGRAYPYNYSMLGMMEYYLDGMETYTLD